jgi:hypothetical protein
MSISALTVTCAGGDKDKARAAARKDGWEF